jgi:glycosyltransferase involved in cell wall biosynthesis
MQLSDTAIITAPRRSRNEGAMTVRGRRIKVVFVIDNMRLGGTELNAVRTAERLDRDRFDLSVVCLGEDGPLTERYRAMGASVENLPIRSFYGPSMLAQGWRLVRRLRREAVDIVHAHDVYSNIFVSAWARLAGVPVVVTSRRWWHSFPNRKLQLGSRWAFSRADAVLANSTQVAKSVREEGNVAASKVWTITNFADDAAFDPLPEAERIQLRRSWNAPDGAVMIGCVARFDPVKDHAGLLRAFALLRATTPDAHLVLIGDGETRAASEALAGELGLGDSVHFAGELRSGGNHHRAFDLSVLASLSEGFPNTLVEAMAAGKPVVATAVGGSIDAVVHEETGLLVPPGQPAELAEALARLAGSAALRRLFGDEGRRRALESFDAASVVGGLEAMYDQLLARAAR